jgi:integrative and conjugative element protein (TIGR02256 family)
MAMSLPFTKKVNRVVLGQLDGVYQRLALSGVALRHVAKHRQLAPWSSEAGGQLFGTIRPEIIHVKEASGPYAGDERSRYRYRSNPEAAQRAIDERSKRGLLYLGEWHTHAEDTPDASNLDDDAMRRLMASSQLNSNALLMLIVGRSRGVSGLALWSVSVATKWLWRLADSAETA